MKTVVSIPDELFERAERLVRETNRSRSCIYGKALREYLRRHSQEMIGQEIIGQDMITQAVDQALKKIGDEDVAFVTAASRRVLKKTEW